MARKRFRLFQDEDSLVPSTKSTPAKSVCISNDELLESLMTPDDKGDNGINAPGKSTNIFIKGLPSSCSMIVPAREDEHGIIDDSFHEELQIKRPVRRRLRRYYSFDINITLSASKRQVEDNVDDEKCTTQDINHLTRIFMVENRPRTAIVNAVDNVCGETDFIADGSKPYCLPTVRGKHSDLKSLTPNTRLLVNIMSGIATDEHGAINIYRGEEVQNLLLQSTMSCFSSKSYKRNILIFHCEFSSERGPKLYRFLRNLDRDMHKEDYPRLTYPEVYLLEGGYKNFYESQKDLCDPCGYKPMLHQDHATDLRHFRVKCKSWTSGVKCRPNRLALRF